MRMGDWSSDVCSSDLGRKDFLRYIIRIPLLHILVNSLLCSANTTAKEVIFMSILLKNFAFSAKEFRCLKSIVAAALLVALHTVLAVFVSINVTPALRISVSFLANCAIGYMFGPVMGFMCGGLGDIIQYIIKPTGPYFPGWTLSAALDRKSTRLNSSHPSSSRMPSSA